MGKIELEGDMYYAVSPHVPIFIALKGKKQGEEIEFKGVKIAILEIY